VRPFFFAALGKEFSVLKLRMVLQKCTSLCCFLQVLKHLSVFFSFSLSKAFSTQDGTASLTVFLFFKERPHG
jgi:hypothetical protein